MASRGHDGPTDSTAIAPLIFEGCQRVEAQNLPTHLGGDVDNPLSTVVQVGLVGGELGGLGEQGLQVGNGCGTCSIRGPSGIPSQSYHSHHRHLLPYVPGEMLIRATDPCLVHLTESGQALNGKQDAPSLPDKDSRACKGRGKSA